MRWKLLLLASLVAALLGFGLWCVITIAFFGTATELARRDWAFLASLLLPFASVICAGVFVYRHTSRRRKTQAMASALLTALLFALTYLVAARAFRGRFRFSQSTTYMVGSAAASLGPNPISFCTGLSESIMN